MLELIKKTETQEKINLMSRVVTVRTLDKDMQERNLLISWDDDSVLLPGIDFWSAAERLNSAAISQIVGKQHCELAGYLSTGYMLKDGIYQKIINWLPHAV
ncbi:MAG: hypothetical protein DI598_14045 [Pseudopedobacter saltans]|uniref:Uncharacterized protein n=1 Tax=Pseudopedobacter saltans TaxID=151895 RepID=A0A2W5EL64_9SPHI|nr:MAG: hypothetical protein DI598_14045 [Pseudopedobacter saltans]